MPDSHRGGLVKSGAIAKNTLWNLIGQVAPSLAAIFTIPVLIGGLGIDRFGILTLAWMIIGYFSLFDFGLGRALVNQLSEKLGNGCIEEIPGLVWTTLTLMSILGTVGTALLFGLSNKLVTETLSIPPELTSQTITAFYLLALSIPIVILTTGLRGILESYQRFDLINIVRVPLGTLTFVVPIGILPFTKRMDIIVLALLVVRVIVLIVHFFYANILFHLYLGNIATVKNM